MCVCCDPEKTSETFGPGQLGASSAAPGLWPSTSGVTVGPSRCRASEAPLNAGAKWEDLLWMGKTHGKTIGKKTCFKGFVWFLEPDFYQLSIMFWVEIWDITWFNWLYYWKIEIQWSKTVVSYYFTHIESDDNWYLVCLKMRHMVILKGTVMIIHRLYWWLDMFIILHFWGVWSLPKSAQHCNLFSSYLRLAMLLVKLATPMFNCSTYMNVWIYIYIYTHIYIYTYIYLYLYIWWYVGIFWWKQPVGGHQCGKGIGSAWKNQPLCVLETRSLAHLPVRNLMAGTSTALISSMWSHGSHGKSWVNPPNASFNFGRDICHFSPGCCIRTS